MHGGQKPGAGGGVVLGEDMLGVTLLAGQQLVDYNFCEQEPASTVEPLPASLFGRVHVDTDGDCELDDDELTLDGVVVRLLDTSGAEVDSTTTDVDGKYSFVNIPPGTYTIVEEQPAEWLEGVAKVGSAGGEVIDASRISNITLTPGGTAVNYDFCERPPVVVPPEIEVPPETVEPEPSSISGIVFVDGNGDCLQDADEPPLEGVTIELRNANGGFIASTMTDSSGHYMFGNLAPGSYQVFEQQPDGLYPGWTDSRKPAMARSSVMTCWASTLFAGQHLVDYNFCEIGPSSISGHVWQESDPNQRYEPGDTPIPGVLDRADR